jgi:hypothetical protein
MTPLTSVPGGLPTRPPATFQSTGFTPAARTLMSTSPRPALGTGRVATDSPPPESTRTACICCGAAAATPGIIISHARIRRMSDSSLPSS